jgi:hypothetical protein
MTIENAKRDGVRCILQAAGSQSAGSIRSIPPAGFQDVFVRRVSPIETKKVQIRYDLLINKNLSDTRTRSPLLRSSRDIRLYLVAGSRLPSSRMQGVRGRIDLLSCLHSPRNR